MTLETLALTPWAENIMFWLRQALWQGTILGALLAIGLRYTSVQRVRLRYMMALTVLSGIVLLPLVNTAWFFFTEHNVPSVSNSTIAEVVKTSEREGAWFVNAAQTQFRTTLGSFAQPLHWQGFVMALYLLGITFLSLRIAFQLFYMRRLRRTAIPAATKLRAHMKTLVDRVGTPAVPHLAFSSRVDTAMVLGWRVPVILLPIGITSKLSSSQLDGVLAHELAHIKRRDYPVNLVQCVIEILFFYHPVVWWVSGAARREREGCCDNLAVQVCGGHLPYIEALITLERRRTRSLTAAVSLKDGDLTARVQRLLKGKIRHPNPLGLALRLGLALLLSICVGFTQKGTTFFERQKSDTKISDDFSTMMYGAEFIVLNAESIEYFTDSNVPDDIPYRLYQPTKIPKGFDVSRDFVYLRPQDLVLTFHTASIRMSAESSLALQQQPLTTFRGHPVGASAKVTRVSVDGNTGEYVKGRWRQSEARASTENNPSDEQSSLRNTDKWINGGNTHMLIWQQNGFVFTLMIDDTTQGTATFDQQAILEIAESLAPTISRP